MASITRKYGIVTNAILPGLCFKYCVINENETKLTKEGTIVLKSREPVC